MYDYVIVGAGSAGCVLAARLSEDPDARVLLLEAGGRDSAPNVKIPAAFSALFRSRWDWDFTTQPQKQLNGRSIYWPRGRMLGGSSSINAMIYIRGHRTDYDRWRDRWGCEGWGYDDVLPYFTRSEDNGSKHDRFHGVGGPLHVNDQRSPRPLSAAMVDAAVEAGIPRNDDFNGATQEGVGLYQVTQHRGRRWSTADAFLRPVLGRPNLQVWTDALVHRITFRGTTATGVAVERAGTVTEVASSEVILAGGTVGSPHILMRSGVGPAHHLIETGVDVVADVPGVGQNLQDHLAAGPIFATSGGSLLDADATPNVLNWLLRGRGPLTSNVAEAGAFVTTAHAGDVPDIQLHLAPAHFIEEGLVEPKQHAMVLAACLLRPRSSGQIRLKGPDPRWAPLIEPNYVDDPTDLDVLMAGVDIAMDIATRPALSPWREDRLLPPPSATDEGQVREAVKDQVQTLYHPVGTCAMGTHDEAVVDPAELRVRGLDGVRVVDASVMPDLIGGNTNAPTIMIAEKAADAIRAAS